MATDQTTDGGAERRNVSVKRLPADPLSDGHQTTGCNCFSIPGERHLPNCPLYDPERDRPRTVTETIREALAEMKRTDQERKRAERR